MTQSEFQTLKSRFASADLVSFRNHMHDHFYLSAVVDREFVRCVMRLKKDFILFNFVETGTHEGLTSWTVSPLFSYVFTCDISDMQRPVQFWLAENITYETSPSMTFLPAHKEQIAHRSLFFLDAHGDNQWPVLDELKWIFENCDKPVIVIDDYDAGNGLRFESHNGISLNAHYIAPLVPAHYSFFVNPYSRRMAGMIFLFPANIVPYGCLFSSRAQYYERTHGLWEQA